MRKKAVVEGFVSSDVCVDPLLTATLGLQRSKRVILKNFIIKMETSRKPEVPLRSDASHRDIRNVTFGDAFFDQVSEAECGFRRRGRDEDLTSVSVFG